MVGVAPRLVRDPYGTLDRIARIHGDVAQVPVPGMDLVLVSHPEHVRHVMLKHPDLPASMTDVMFREGPRFHAMANGHAWKRVKKALTPTFTLRGLEPVRPLINEAITESIDGWERYADTGEQVDMQHQLSLLTMSVLLRAMFTQPAPRADVERVAACFPHINVGMTVSMFTSPLPARMPRPFDRRFGAAKAAVLAHIDAMVADRRRSPIDNGDLLSMVLNATFEDGRSMTEEEIRRELLGLMFAGYETTATAMSWVFALLPSAPAAQARACEEVDALGGPPATAEEQKHLTWLRACFDEAQRLQGVLFARETAFDDELDGFHIPAGTTVMVSGRRLHRDPRWWREPDRFDPSRFLDDEIDRYAFVPFGAGPRRCLGAQMAYMVGLSALAAALQRFRFDVPAGWHPEPRFLISTVVKGGVPAVLRAR